MIKHLKAIILGFIITFGASYVFGSVSAIASWSEPCSFTTQPNCNTDLPVNVSATSQAKLGTLNIGSTASIAPGYVFSVINGTSLLQSLVTTGLTIADGNQAEGKVLKYNSTTKKGYWADLSNSVASTNMTLKDFTITVSRNSTQSSVIPSTYQYCAISQMGPDFVNSDQGSSVCSVNHNNDGTWTLYGNRLDDPDFICKARCFSVDAKTAVYGEKTNFIPSPGSAPGFSETGISGKKIYLR